MMMMMVVMMLLWYYVCFSPCTFFFNVELSIWRMRWRIVGLGGGGYVSFRIA